MENKTEVGIYDLSFDYIKAVEQIFENPPY